MRTGCRGPPPWPTARRPRVALHTGDAALAVEEARASVAAAEKVSARVDAAMSRILLGRALIERRVTPSAPPWSWRRRRPTSTPTGRPVTGTWPSSSCARLGHHVRPAAARPARPGARAWTRLSERELEVARLVVDRRTNPEIAADLFLSLKTVETHMRNIFRKLGVSSRVEVARVLERAAPG